MDFAADFTAIDFETANRRSDSACQLGMVKVRAGRVVDQASWLIRPRPLYFHRTHIEIHGITPDDVREQPEFRELWPEISIRLGDDCLVAHNASFDLRVLIATLRSHRLAIPELPFTCTRAIARRTWPHRRRYGLKPLSEWLGIRFQHHDALEDSQACAKILLAAGIDREAISLADLERRLRLRRGKAGTWGIQGPTASSRVRRASESVGHDGHPGIPLMLPNQLGGSSSTAVGDGSRPGDPGGSNPGDSEVDVQRLLVRAEFIRPLAGMRVVLTGRFRVLNPEQARSLALRSGATCQDAVDESTNVLVVGQISRSRRGDDQPCEEFAANLPLGSLQELRTKLQVEGRAIRVVSEDEFIALVGSRSSAP